jgi:hypothetical protein
MNPRKPIFDLAPTTLDRKQRWYINARTEEIEDLDARKTISLEAKWTWIRLKGVLAKSEQPGILIENGEPMSSEALAVELRRRPSSVRKLEREIQELLNDRVLRKHKGFIYDYTTLSDEWSRYQKKRRESGEDSESFEEVLGRFPEVFPKFYQSFPKFSQNSISETSAPADSSNGFSEGESKKFSQNSKNQTSGSSKSSIRNEVTNTGLIAEAHRSAQNSAGTIAPLTENGQTTAPSSSAYTADDSELTRQSAEFPDIDVRAEYSKWRAYCQKHDQPATRERFVGWLRLAVKHAEKRERPAKPKKRSAASAKRTAEPASNGDATASEHSNAEPNDTAATAAAKNAAREADEARRQAENERRQAEQAAFREAQEKATQDARIRDERLPAEARKPRGGSLTARPLRASHRIPKYLQNALSINDYESASYARR